MHCRTWWWTPWLCGEKTDTGIFFSPVVIWWWLIIPLDLESWMKKLWKLLFKMTSGLWKLALLWFLINILHPAVLEKSLDGTIDFCKHHSCPLRHYHGWTKFFFGAANCMYFFVHFRKMRIEFCCMTYIFLSIIFDLCHLSVLLLPFWCSIILVR